MTGEHQSDCPALLHVLSQDNCGFLLPARVTCFILDCKTPYVQEDVGRPNLKKKTPTLLGRLQHLEKIRCSPYP
ncbi:hypothetical protein TNCV_36641 [Trichonephila clavipes]|nr:hypothetical protein TNCV_36641 [Trichonephila clavipes]